MNYRCINQKNDTLMQLFFDLPKRLYDKNTLTQDVQVEKQIIDGTHVLSKDFKVQPFIVVNENDDIVSRCILTYYPNDTTAYIGFFESYDNLTACKLLMSTIEKQVKKDNKSKIVGPIDASFWIKYRFKVDKFDTPYTGEPYNLEYYPKLWYDCGFKVSERYYSNYIRVPTSNDKSTKYQRRLETILKKGYIIKSPTKDTFDNNLIEIYNLLIDLYSTFPCYKYITQEQFCRLFSSLKYVLNYNMVKLAYQHDSLVGFFISIPNYGNLTYGKITPLRLLRILKRKYSTNEYVLMYMGVDGSHLGLGSVLAELIEQELFKNSYKSIGALIHYGKASGTYYKNLIVNKSDYILLEKNVL